ncbi:hypothetical protein KFK09_016434 [Dendrobium nobile]|uniref:Uncharacterized protein n=1 Tax=Dendrobium nobile TaxID=94219 RepID=A0A8T3AYQ0_DENNO|nr:hypothetical protein KFK09_016434 [Dendrobium nobile]
MMSIFFSCQLANNFIIDINCLQDSTELASFISIISMYKISRLVFFKLNPSQELL